MRTGPKRVRTVTTWRSSSMPGGAVAQSERRGLLEEACHGLHEPGRAQDRHQNPRAVLFRQVECRTRPARRGRRGAPSGSRRLAGSCRRWCIRAPSPRRRPGAGPRASRVPRAPAMLGEAPSSRRPAPAPTDSSTMGGGGPNPCGRGGDRRAGGRDALARGTGAVDRHPGQQRPWRGPARAACRGARSRCRGRR